MSLQDKAQLNSEKIFDIAAIRKLLADALDDNDLIDLCYDHFPKVYGEFSGGMGNRKRRRLLIGYCERHNQLEQLVHHIQGLNPEKYEEYKNRLYQPVNTESKKSLLGILSGSPYKRVRYVIVTVPIIAVLMIIWFIWLNNLSQPQPFEDGKFGIIIADFGRGTELADFEKGKDITEVIYRDFLTKIQEAGLSNVDVIRWETIRNENEARRIGTQLRASIVVWGRASNDGEIFFPTSLQQRTCQN